MQVERWAESRRRGRELIGWGGNSGNRAGLITLMLGRCDGNVKLGRSTGGKHCKDTTITQKTLRKEIKVTQHP